MTEKHNQVPHHPELGTVDTQGHLELDLALVGKVARLARLAPDTAEQQALSRQLGQILEHFQNIEQLDTEGVEPAYHPQELLDSLRPDVLMPSLDPEIFMALTPRHKDGCLMVPRTFD